MINTTISTYKIIRQIGEGGMGTVYYAEGRYGIKVAIKMLKPELASVPKFCNRFINEAKSMIQLQGHPYIVQIYDMVEHDNKPALIMEYLDGCNLNQYVQQNGVITKPALLLEWLKQLLYALDYAHNMSPKLIHRDIKPSNLFLTKFGTIKLLDFGIVRIMEECTNSNKTELAQTTTFAGSRSYISPEQEFDAKLVDERSDIYSVGKTLEYLLTQNNPFADIEIEPFKSIIEKSTQKKPQNRYQSCKELLSLLKNVVVKDVEIAKPVRKEKKTANPVPPAQRAAEFIMVKGGVFNMGAAGDGPIHQVEVSDFYIGKYPVTQKFWKEVMGNNPSTFTGDNLPVESVSWLDCVKFCNKLNSKEGYEECYRINGKNVKLLPQKKGYRLPTEAEWEYAARGGNNSKGYKYSGSNILKEVGWYDKNSGSKTHTVDEGGKEPNELGIYGMSGNVWEWCYDWYASYSSGKQTNSIGPSTGASRVRRGGSYDDGENHCSVAYRLFNSSGFSYNFLGLRLALVP